MVQIEAGDDPERGAPERLNEEAEVGVHEADAVVPREEIIRDTVSDIQEDAIHACEGRKREGCKMFPIIAIQTNSRETFSMLISVPRTPA